MINFEWDIKKADTNLLKHLITFEEASEVFYDFHSFIFDDLKHSEKEKRELIIGQTKSNQIIIVSFTVRENKIRIINARLANKKEKKEYGKNQK
jgi:hypothetical protein